MKISIVPKWMLPFGYGLTLYKWAIVAKGPYQAELTAHEAEHVRQWVEEGFFMWPAKYLYYLLRYGYKNNPFEIQAREAAIKNAWRY